MISNIVILEVSLSSTPKWFSSLLLLQTLDHPTLCLTRRMEVIDYYKKSRVRTEDHIKLKVVTAKKYKLKDAYTKNAEALRITLTQEVALQL